MHREIERLHENGGPKFSDLPLVLRGNKQKEEGGKGSGIRTFTEPEKEAEKERAREGTQASSRHRAFEDSELQSVSGA